MTTVLSIVSVLSAIVALFTVSTATLGPTAIGAACWLAILARLNQADRHDRELGPFLETLANRAKRAPKDPAE